MDALIKKGGTAGPSSHEETKKGATPVLVRVPGDLLEKVYQALSERRVKIPRHTWLLEAIVEKLEREVS